jgi:predicted MFS family arabinose efflux permease
MRADGKSVALVYGSGIAQGLALVAFPALGNLLRDRHAHGLSAGEYGGLFLPMILGAVAASSTAGSLARWRGMKPVLVAGLACDLLAMVLLASSGWLVGRHGLALALVGVAITLLGLGFGLALTAMNGYAGRFFPERTDAALTVLHACVGVGTALPPLLLTLAMRLGGWFYMPLAIAVLLALLAVGVARAPLGDDARSASPTRLRLGGRPAAFIAIALVYGVCEALLGNWGTVYLHEERGVAVGAASLALSAFWASLTAGRLMIAALSRLIAPRASYVVLPAVLGAAFFAASHVHGSAGAALTFAAAGFGCSAFLPLTISFASAGAVDAETIGGVAIAAFMAGSGMGSFGAGLVHQHARVAIGDLYRSGIVLTILLFAGAVTWFIAGARPPRRCRT